MAVKYIFVTGGVVSGLGKGIAAASLGRLLKQRGLRVKVQKLDPYLNVDPGTMNPFQHGEVFVTEDGAETDLDLGHYERFTDEDLTVDSSVTSGKVYWTVLNREREGEYLGGTVQVIPHITDEIKERVYRVGRRGDVDVVITDYGIAINPRRQDLIECMKDVDLPFCTIEELRDKAYAMVGEPDPVQFDDRIVGVIEARDGTILDVVRQIKEYEFS